MANFNGVVLTQNTGIQSQKAQDLYDIVGSVVKKIEEIDAEIMTLVKGGMEGSSVAAMANTYLKNREVINDYVKRFAAIACLLDENAVTMKNIDSTSEVAAGGRQ